MGAAELQARILELEMVLMRTTNNLHAAIDLLDNYSPPYLGVQAACIRDCKRRVDKNRLVLSPTKPTEPIWPELKSGEDEYLWEQDKRILSELQGG